MTHVHAAAVRSIRLAAARIRHGGKTCTVTSNKTTSKTFTGLKSKKKYYVWVRTYKTVNGTKHYSAWSARSYITTK